MGFDIDIGEFIIRGGAAKMIRSVDQTYLSFQWRTCICHQHSFVNDGRCPCDCPFEQIHLWSVRNDCHARRGDDVEQRAQNALEKLAKMGIGIGQPDITNSSWGWGLNNNNDNLSTRERLGVFAYHLDRLRQLGQQYPQCFFIVNFRSSDGPSLPDCLVLPGGMQVAVVGDYAEVEEIDSDKIKFVHHPFKCLFRIHNFRSAMEFYEIKVAQNDPEAGQWYELALQMHDAPVG
jgi:hypothetical protein